MKTDPIAVVQEPLPFEVKRRVRFEMSEHPVPHLNVHIIIEEEDSQDPSYWNEEARVTVNFFHVIEQMRRLT